LEVFVGACHSRASVAIDGTGDALRLGGRMTMQTVDELFTLRALGTASGRRRRGGKMQDPSGDGGANRLDDGSSIPADGACGNELEQLRACARFTGAWKEHGREGWFGRALRERLQSAKSRGVASEGTPRERAERQIARACRKTAMGGGIASAGAHVGELATLVTEGLAVPLAIPEVLASVVAERVYSAVVQIDLACDLAMIYGVPFDVSDAGELGAIFDVVLFAGRSRPSRPRATLERLVAPDDTELLARIGRGLLEEALLGLVPLLGIPCTLARNYRATRRLGDRVLAHVRRRRAVRDTLGTALDDPQLDKVLLLEGAWLLAICDDELTHDEELLLSSLVRSIPSGDRPRLDRLRYIGEGAWVVRVALLDESRRERVLAAFQMLAALRGSTGPAERAFFARIGDALEATFDVDRIEDVHRGLTRQESFPTRTAHANLRSLGDYGLMKVGVPPEHSRHCRTLR
jgi:hypothetical protein